MTTRRETHEIVWEGKLTGAQFRELVIDALRRGELPTLGWSGISIELTIGDHLLPSEWPDVHFTVTRDELWYQKPRDEA